MPVPWRRGVPVPYPFYLMIVGIVAAIILFVQQPELATRAISSFSLAPLSPPIQQTPFSINTGDTDAVKRKRVAIVGAGASGSSAAFFLARAAREAESRAGLPHGSLLDIVVFEREPYVGGRATVVHPHGVESLRPIELGASIFVEANRNLVKAAKLFNLDIVDPEWGDTGVGIWDGVQFLFSTTPSKSRWSDWWDTLAALRRYGAFSPMRQNRAVGALLKKFKRLYDPAWLANRGSVADVDEFASSADLGQLLTTRTGEDWARHEVKANSRWVSEIMESSTRVNYCLDMDEIHGLGAAVSLATGGASTIAGGNFQIFKGMLADSGADVRLSTSVESIEPTKSGFRVVSNATTKSDQAETFDEIFFGAPWHSSPVSKNLSTYFTQPIPRTPYATLHVTLLATTSPSPDPLYFYKDPSEVIPGTIVTTDATWRDNPKGARPEFQSITYHGETYEGSGEWVVKIFSKDKMDNTVLEEIFGSPPTWVFRKVWEPYPLLHPTASFPPMQPMKGFHYLASFEPWISTMETQTISAREAVARVVQRWWNLGLGECRNDAESWDLTCGK